MTPTGTSMEMRTGWGIKLRGGGGTLHLVSQRPGYPVRTPSPALY